MAVGSVVRTPYVLLIITLLCCRYDPREDETWRTTRRIEGLEEVTQCVLKKSREVMLAASLKTDGR